MADNTPTYNVYQKDGRRWTVDGSRITTLRRKYLVEPTAGVLGANGEVISFGDVPAIGTSHPTYAYLKVKSYDIEEGEGIEKKLLTVYVNYEPETIETAGEGQSAVSSQVDQWGWDSGTDEKELTMDANGLAILNSAGDPFDSVPRVSSPAPVFTKVIKFASRQSGALSYNCKTNSSSITIGDMSCPAGSLLCTVSEKRLFGDADWKYVYTVQLKYKSNLVKISGGSTLTDIGWDVSITDAGMRQLDANGKLVLIRQKDGTTGKLATISSPELLDGSGHAVDRSSTVNPWNFRFKAYDDTTFPGWFYSEPA